MTERPIPPAADRLCPVIRRESLGGAYVLLTFAHPEVAKAEAGQFAMIQPEAGTDLILRRPFSIMDTDPEAGHFTVFLKAVGPGSKAVFDLREGENARVLGPLGHGSLRRPPGSTSSSWAAATVLRRSLCSLAVSDTIRPFDAREGVNRVFRTNRRWHDGRPGKGLTMSDSTTTAAATHKSEASAKGSGGGGGEEKSRYRATLNLPNIGQFTDPGFNNPLNSGETSETFTYSINWGDGTPLNTGVPTIDTPGGPGLPTTGSFDGSHIYADNGVYTVTVTVMDDDGGVTVQTFEVTVNNVAPTLTVAPDTTVGR